MADDAKDQGGDGAEDDEEVDQVAEDLLDSSLKHSIGKARRPSFHKKKSQEAVGGVNSFGSNVTDYDGYMHPSAQAELDQHEYFRNYAAAYDNGSGEMFDKGIQQIHKASFGRNATASFGSNPGGGPTASFGSNATDFDNLTSLGAQAEHDEHYLSAIAAGEAAFLQMKGSGQCAPPGMAGMSHLGMPGMPMGMHAMAMGMPYPAMGVPGYAAWPGYPPMGAWQKGGEAADLNAQAASLEMAAAQFREAARQAEESSGRTKSDGFTEGNDKGNSRGRPRVGSSREEIPPPTDPDQLTTLMVKNLPNDYTRDMVLELLDDKGFKGKYDFIYVPVDFKRWAGLGYAFVNMLTHRDALELQEKLNGYATWKKMSSKVCEVAWGEPYQGLDAHIQRYRNSPVMHPDVPDEAKPVIFENGERKKFPEPTKRIQAPRLKR